jgi:hypothetical protein
VNGSIELCVVLSIMKPFVDPFKLFYGSSETADGRQQALYSTTGDTRYLNTIGTGKSPIRSKYVPDPQ